MDLYFNHHNIIVNTTNYTTYIYLVNFIIIAIDGKKIKQTFINLKNC